MKHIFSPLPPDTYFQAVGDKMNDGSRSSIIPGDILKVKPYIGHPGKTSRKDLNRIFVSGQEIELLIKIDDDCFVGLFSQYDKRTNTIRCRFLNPDKKNNPDLRIKLSDVTKLYQIESLQRSVGPSFKNKTV